MPEWFKNILDQWAVVVAAPVPFMTVSIAILIAVSIGASFLYSTRLSNKDGEISLLTRQRDDYRDKLGGASPDQAKAKIEALERTVNLTIGSKWDALTRGEIAALSARLSAIVPALARSVRVQIMYENALGKDLARSFYEAFQTSQWSGATFGPGGGLGPGITTGQGSGAALALKEAIETTSRHKVEVLRPEQPEWPQLIFLAVGINDPVDRR